MSHEIQIVTKRVEQSSGEEADKKDDAYGDFTVYITTGSGWAGPT
jgi:hypothetical protein